MAIGNVGTLKDHQRDLRMIVYDSATQEVSVREGNGEKDL